jgi:predicted esterase
MNTDIHQGQEVLSFGAEIPDAKILTILLHGRGANAGSIIPLAEALDIGSVRFLIPQAAQNRWYPQSAFGPLEANEPDLSSALGVINTLVIQARDEGFSSQQIFFGGFSQGACLASEYVARNANRYGGLFVYSGALIGPPGMPRDYPGGFDNMPVFIGGSDVDPWVTHDLMQETAKIFEQMGADVDFRTYPGMAHTINPEEIDLVRGMLANSKVAS